MKLYAVTKGDYSDYHIITLTADKKAAKEIAKMFSDGEYDEAKVEEYEDGKIIIGKKLYFVRVVDGNVDDVVVSNSDYELFNTSVFPFYMDRGKENYYTHVLTDTAEKAAKIGKDRIMKYIAEKENL
jgi:hypothetical protein